MEQTQASKVAAALDGRWSAFAHDMDDLTPLIFYFDDGIQRNKVAVDFAGKVSLHFAQAVTVHQDSACDASKIHALHFVKADVALNTPFILVLFINQNSSAVSIALLELVQKLLLHQVVGMVSWNFLGGQFRFFPA